MPKPATQKKITKPEKWSFGNDAKFLLCKLEKYVGSLATPQKILNVTNVSLATT